MFTIEEMNDKLNKIHCMDCLDFMREVPDKYFDLVLTDPPYKFEVHRRGIAQNREYLKNGFKKIGSHADYDIYNIGFIEECVRITKKTNIFVFCNKSQIFDILKKVYELSLNFEIIIFGKTSPTPLTNNQWLPDKEYGVHIFKNLTVYGDYSTKKSFYVDSSFKDTTIKHPTAKPLRIVKNLLKNLTDSHSKVFDPFIGSGTTAICCDDIGIEWCGCEIDKDYCEIANKRLSQVQGSLF